MPSCITHGPLLNEKLGSDVTHQDVMEVRGEFGWAFRFQGAQLSRPSAPKQTFQANDLKLRAALKTLTKNFIDL